MLFIGVGIAVAMMIKHKYEFPLILVLNSVMQVVWWIKPSYIFFLLRESATGQSSKTTEIALVERQ